MSSRLRPTSVTKSASKPTATGRWADSLGNLFTKSYFTCRKPNQFNYADFLEWTKQHNMSKERARLQWDIARRHFEKSKHQVLRDAAVRLNKDWNSGTHKQDEEDFFQRRNDKKKLEGERRKVHQDVDNVLSKRQRVDYQAEEANLDMILESHDKDNEDAEVTVSPPMPQLLEVASHDYWTPPPLSSSTIQLRVQTENTDSPMFIPSNPLTNPFMDSEDEPSILSAVPTHTFEFQGKIGEIELGSLFTTYHAATVQMQVPITSVQDVLSRSGILLLNGTISPTLRQHIPETTLENVLKTFSNKHWPIVDVSEDRDNIRHWLDMFEDEISPEETVQKLIAIGNKSPSCLRL
ncbi:hypothetical protein BGX20_005215, partial [Mortierella sp. AD010]